MRSQVCNGSETRPSYLICIEQGLSHSSD